jgi:hypothetical protein
MSHAHTIRRLSGFGLAHLTAALALLLSAVTVASDVFRGCEQTDRDFRSIATSIQNLLTFVPTLDQSREKIEVGRQYLRRTTILYLDSLIKIVIQSDRDQRDILASFEALKLAWREVRPTYPLTISFLHSPSFDPSLGGRVASWSGSSAQIDEGSFEAMLPILRDIRDLIRESEGDECGRGKLLLSGYGAEPARPNSDGALNDERP